jgi:Zn-dependent M28 family amino/carboxypeptidase
MKRINVRNVVAMIEGVNKDEVIVVGAHMDHMGMSEGRVWNGADDNASGTVGVMTIASAFAATGVKPQKTVLFCAWTGEEKGLLGSEYFTLNPTVGEIDQYKFYLNYDMISRDSDNDEEGINCGITYTKAYSSMEEITNKNKEDFNINLNLNFRPSEEPRGGSDHTPFTDQKIPIMYMMAGFPDEYHTPEDEVELINWDKMLEIIKLGFLNMWDIANSDL